MFRLDTLGGLVLTDEAGSSVTLQRRRLALLALVAAAGDRGISRDRLVAFLWPESRADSARHNLEQLLYVLRRQFDEELFSGTDPLRLNHHIIASDVAAFEHALAHGEDAVAAAAYRGPFLEGFYLADAGEFERWADGERMRLAGAYAAALERLATQAAERGDQGSAVEFWRKLVAADTLSSRHVLGLLRALAAAGDRPEALRLAATYEALIREELDISPEPALVAFVAELRATRVSPVEPAVAPTPAPAMSADAEPTVAPVVLPLLPTPPEHPAAAERVGDRRFRPRPVIVVAALIVLAIITTWGARAWTSSERDAATDPNRILVPPFRVTSGDSSYTHMREFLPVLMAAHLTGEGGPAAIDTRTTLRALRRASRADDGEVTEEGLLEIARELGAGEVLLGEVIVTAPGILQLRARLVSNTRGRGAAVRASASGAADSVVLLVDRLTGQLLALRAGEHPQRIASLAMRPPEALRAFLQGRAEQRRGHAITARISFARALEYDSTFAPAALELALGTANVFRWTTLTTDTVFRQHGISLGGDIHARSDEDLWNRAMELAWRGRDQLAAADLALLRALRVNYPEDHFAHETLAGWEDALRTATDRPEAHYWYGYVLLHQGFALGLADSQTRAASSFAHAFDLDSTYLSPLVGLIEIKARERDSRALRRLRATYLVRDSVGSNADYVRWLVAAATADEAELRTIRPRLASFDVGTLARIQRTSQLAGIALEDAHRADSAILARTHEAAQRQVALYRAIFLLLNRGQPKEALRLLALKRELDPGPELGQWFTMVYALMWDGDSAAGARAARAAALRPHNGGGPILSNADRTAIKTVALWRLWHGDTTGVADAMARLRRVNDPLADLLDGLLADVLHRPDAPAALVRLDSLALRGCCSQPHFINLVAARLHERAGDLPAALRAIRRGRWFHPAEYLSTYLREEGRLAAATGDTAGAIAAYRDYLTLRSDAEPSLQPAVTRVRAELARLEREPAQRAWWRRLRDPPQRGR